MIRDQLIVVELEFSFELQKLIRKFEKPSHLFLGEFVGERFLVNWRAHLFFSFVFQSLNVGRNNSCCSHHVRLISNSNLSWRENGEKVAILRNSASFGARPVERDWSARSPRKIDSFLRAKRKKLKNCQIWLC